MDAATPDTGIADGNARIGGVPGHSRRRRVSVRSSRIGCAFEEWD